MSANDHHGILYASHISAATLSSPPRPVPTHSLTRLATAVLTSQPAQMMIVVNTGWQSSTTAASVHSAPSTCGMAMAWCAVSASVETSENGESGELTSQAEAGGHPAEDVANDPLAVELVLVEELERAHDERVCERRVVRVQRPASSPAAAALRIWGVVLGIRAPDGEAEEEEELGEGGVEECERDVRVPAGTSHDGGSPDVSQQSEQRRWRMRMRTRITPGRRREKAEKRGIKGKEKLGSSNLTAGWPGCACRVREPESQRVRPSDGRPSELGGSECLSDAIRRGSGSLSGFAREARRWP